MEVYQKLLPGRPIVGLSNSSNSIKNVHLLKKTFNEEEFYSLLSKLDRKKTVFDTNPNPIRSVYSIQSSTSHYPIKNCFQDSLIKTWKIHKELNQAIELIFLNKPVLLMHEGKVITFLTDERLQQLCSLTINDHSISTALISTIPQGLIDVDLSYFIAKVVLWSSCGRLPEGVNPTDIVHLINTNEHHALPEIEGAKLIQNLWRIDSYSLLETQQVLQIHQSDLYSFFSVLYALEFIEIQPSTPSSVKKERLTKKIAKQGWLEKLFLKRERSFIPHTII